MSASMLNEMIISPANSCSLCLLTEKFYDLHHPTPEKVELQLFCSTIGGLVDLSGNDIKFGERRNVSYSVISSVFKKQTIVIVELLARLLKSR